MDDLGSAVYVIVTIIAIIFSVLKKANKNKSTKPFSAKEKHQSEHEFPDFETLFQDKDEQEDEEEDFMPVFKRVDLPSKEPVKKEAAFVKSDFQKKMEELERNAERNSYKKKQKPTFLLENEISEKEEQWFDAKKAIIYSEILKRPEF